MATIQELDRKFIRLALECLKREGMTVFAVESYDERVRVKTIDEAVEAAIRYGMSNVWLTDDNLRHTWLNFVTCNTGWDVLSDCSVYADTLLERQGYNQEVDKESLL